MIDIIGLRRQYAEISDEINEVVDRVLRGGWYILGEELTHFEQEFSSYVGTRHAIGTNSGSDALLLSVRALGIGRGDEVITVSHTFISTVDGIVRNNAQPVFVDIDPDTFCIDPAQIEDKITERTKAIIPVHLYGHPADMTPILEIAKRHDLFVIEDACQAHGAEYKGQRVGGIGDVGCFSFYPAKNLGAYGDGGLVATNNSEIAEKLKMLRNYGQQRKHAHACVAINSRLDEIQAAVLRVKLKHLDRWNERRREIARQYTELLSGADVVTPVEKKYARHVYHQYVVKSKERDALQQRLSQSRIRTQVHYPTAVHKQTAYRDLGFDVRLPVTERICGEILSLPIHPWLSEADVLTISDAAASSLR